MAYTNTKTGLVQTAWRYPRAIHDRLIAMQRERQEDALQKGDNPATISLNALITELVTSHPLYRRELRTERDKRRVEVERAERAAEHRAARAGQQTHAEGRTPCGTP